MTTESFRIAYDGDLVRNGTMDVRDLAPALIAVGDLCRAANRVLNGTEAEVSVLIRSDFEKGSFDIGIQLAQKAHELGLPLAAVIAVVPAAQLLQWIGFLPSLQLAVSDQSSRAVKIVTSVFDFIKTFRGERPSPSVTINAAPGAMVLYFEGGNSGQIGVPRPVAMLANDPQVVDASYRSVQPVKRTGIDLFQSRQGAQSIETITKDELPYFEKATQALSGSSVAPIRHEEPRVTLVEIRKVSFDDDHKNKWSFSEGRRQHPFNATIKDRDFLDKVDRREVVFGRGDVLRVKLLTRSALTPDDLQTEHEILEVIEWLPAMRQAPFAPGGSKPPAH